MIGLAVTHIVSLPPLTTLPAIYTPWEEILKNSKDLILADQFENAILQLPVITTDNLSSEPEFERAYLVMSFIAHYYVHQYNPKFLPKSIAIPWLKISKHLGVEPVISYASTVLYNWGLIDPSKPLSVSNVKCLHTFTGSMDESWFYLVGLFVEIIGNEIVSNLNSLYASLNSSADLKQQLNSLHRLIEQIRTQFSRIYKHCHPSIFYEKVRPFLSGWYNSDKYPTGLRYELETGDQVFTLAGGSAAQSPTIQLLDAILSIKHPSDKYLIEMRKYMPKKFRDLISEVEQKSIRQFLIAKDRDSEYSECIEIFDSCVISMKEFRDDHIKVVALYVTNQSSKKGIEAKGTGGTSPIPFLKGSRDETILTLIKK